MLKKGAWVVFLGLLPVWPLGFSVLLLALGLVSFKRLRRYPVLVAGALLYVLFGCVSQVLAPPLEQPRIPPWPGPPATANLMSPNIISRLVGFNLEDKQVTDLIHKNGDFWRMPRVNPQTKRPFIEMHLFQTFPIQAGTTYTQSVFFRHDGSQVSFQFTFFTARGHHPVPTRIVDMGGGLKRAYATYQAQPGDKFVRGLDLVNFQGDWTYLDLAFPQLEPASTPSAYRLPNSSMQPLVQRMGWFVGTALLGLLAFAAAPSLLTYRELAPGALAVGLMVSLGIVTGQLLNSPLGWNTRAAGLVSHPNFLGHLAVMVLGLILFLGNRRWFLAGLLASLGLIWFSGSRGALIGLVPIVVFWLGSLGIAGRRLAFGVLGIVLVFTVWLGSHNDLGRFSTIFDPNYGTTTSRVAIWQAASSVIRDYLWTGVGVGSFPYYYSLRGAEGAIENSLPHAHNLALQILSESGLLGLVGFTALLGSAVFILWRSRSWVGLVFVASLLLLNLFDYSFFNEVAYYPFWLIVGWSSLKVPQSIAVL